VNTVPGSLPSLGQTFKKLSQKYIYLKFSKTSITLEELSQFFSIKMNERESYFLIMKFGSSPKKTLGRISTDSFLISLSTLNAMHRYLKKK
jgi:hypothetical protein